MGLFSRLTSGLAKTRAGLLGSLKGIFSGRVDEQFYEELEEALIVADVGVQTAVELADRLREQAKREHIKERAELWQTLRLAMTEMLQIEGVGQLELMAGQLNIFIITGVNGVGKTTTLGKLAAHYHAQGKRVLLAAADTFRAAAADQLAVWAERAGAGLIRQAEGADPAAVVYDAIAAAKSRDVDVLLVDTAGRLQNKTNLMAELAKISRVVEREAGEAHLENLLVLDAGTGQNALSQAKQFGEAVPLSGLILTKLDGTAKGGAVVGISHESGLPVKLIGVGEGIEDLRPFVPEEFIAALFEE
jgi:fused signal recognition particle receptor